MGKPFLHFNLIFSLQKRLMDGRLSFFEKLSDFEIFKKREGRNRLKLFFLAHFQAGKLGWMVISGPWLTADQKSSDSAEILLWSKITNLKITKKIENWWRGGDSAVVWIYLRAWEIPLCKIRVLTMSLSAPIWRKSEIQIIEKIQVFLKKPFY